MRDRLRLLVWIALVLTVSGIAFGTAILGVPTFYSWWMEYRCWRAGPDGEACWWLDLLKNPPSRSRGNAWSPAYGSSCGTGTLAARAPTGVAVAAPSTTVRV